MTVDNNSPIKVNIKQEAMFPTGNELITTETPSGERLEVAIIKKGL
jgi:2-methylaconitate cis-trans-isomerase PrpF